MTTQATVASMMHGKKRVSHILHAILTVLTLGFWAIVWIAAALHAYQYNKRIDDQIRLIEIEQNRAARPPAKNLYEPERN